VTESVTESATESATESVKQETTATQPGTGIRAHHETVVLAFATATVTANNSHRGPEPGIVRLDPLCRHVAVVLIFSGRAVVRSRPRDVRRRHAGANADRRLRAMAIRIGNRSK